MNSASSKRRGLRISPEALVKAVASYIATIFTAVSLWLGVTVSELTDNVAGLTAAVEAQTRELNRVDDRIDSIESRLHELGRKR